MNYQEIMEELKKPFPPEDIQWRIGRKTKDKTKATVLAYVDARAARERLDSVFGQFNWKVTFTPCDMGVFTVSTYNGDISKQVKGFIATIGVKDPETGEWIEKSDGAGITDVEPFKGGVSDALKRACAAWGIGAYLYKLKETWVCLNDYGQFDTPKLPDWALPEGYTYPVGEVTHRKATPQRTGTRTTSPTTQERLPQENEQIVPSGGLIIDRGKYKGQDIRVIEDYGYLTWIYEKSQFKPEFKEAAKEILQEKGLL